MTDRLDKLGHALRIGDMVRLPTAKDGFIRRFQVKSGRERVIVRYEQPRLGEVVLLPNVVERLYWKDRPRRRKTSEYHSVNSVPFGESHYRARLTDEQVRAMRKLHRRAGKGYMALAAIFGCGVSTARDICTWRTRRDA